MCKPASSPAYRGGAPTTLARSPFRDVLFFGSWGHAGHSGPTTSLDRRKHEE